MSEYVCQKNNMGSMIYDDLCIIIRYKLYVSLHICISWLLAMWPISWRYQFTKGDRLPGDPKSTGPAARDTGERALEAARAARAARERLGTSKRHVAVDGQIGTRLAQDWHKIGMVSASEKDEKGNMRRKQSG